MIRPFPAAAVASAFGFPPDDWLQLSAWIRDVNRNFDRTRTAEEAAQMNAAVVEFEAYLGERIAGAAGDDAFARMVREARDRGLSDEELVRTLTIIFVAGQHVMVKLLGGSSSGCSPALQERRSACGTTRSGFRTSSRRCCAGTCRSRG